MVPLSAERTKSYKMIEGKNVAANDRDRGRNHITTSHIVLYLPSIFMIL